MQINRHRTTLLAIVLLGALTMIGTPIADSDPIPTVDWPTARPDPESQQHIEDLIDQFTTLSQEGSEFNIVLYEGEFTPIHTVSTFVNGMAGEQSPPAPNCVKELAAIGFEALPDLINHLSDARPTGLTLKQPDFGGMWYAAEFDARAYDRAPVPQGTYPAYTDLMSTSDISEHALTVGDICFIVIGQIVNRRYIVDRGQWTACNVINSPTTTPALAQAASEEWKGITLAQYQQSLIADAGSPSTGSEAGEALKRLCYYYPTLGEKTAVSILDRPLCESSIADNFITDDLIELPSFERSDILNIKGLKHLFEHPSDNTSKYVVHAMNEGIGYGSTLDTPNESSTAMADAELERLNHLLTLKNLFSPYVLSKAKLRPEIRKLLNSHSEGFDLMCANRMLLEDLYPSYLVRQRPPNRDSAVWRSRFTRFIAKNGPRYNDYVWSLLSASTVPDAEVNSIATEERSRQIIHALYPNRSPNLPIFINAADAQDQEWIVNSLLPFHDKQLEVAVSRLLEAMDSRVKSMHGRTDVDVNEECNVQDCGLICIQYLNGRGDTAARREFCLRNIRLLKWQVSKTTDNSDLGEYQSYLDLFNEQLSHMN